MALIEYNAFVANVQPLHLELLAEFNVGRRVRYLETDQASIAAARQACLELYQDGVELLTRVSEGYERVNDQTWHTFDGYVTEAATGYTNRLARERVAIHRDPI